MESDFKVEIITPENIIFSGTTSMVTLPSYEGDMSILKNHISIITFLRPGIIKVQKKDISFDEFFTQDGTIEYFNNNLVILSASVNNLKNLSKDFISNLANETKNKLDNKDISDHERYILNHKIDVLNIINI